MVKRTKRVKSKIHVHTPAHHKALRIMKHPHSHRLLYLIILVIVLFITAYYATTRLTSTFEMSSEAKWKLRKSPFNIFRMQAETDEGGAAPAQYNLVPQPNNANKETQPGQNENPAPQNPNGPAEGNSNSQQLPGGQDSGTTDESSQPKTSDGSEPGGAQNPEEGNDVPAAPGVNEDKGLRCPGPNCGDCNNPDTQNWENRDGC